jgi:hypothetical protein
MVYYSVARDKPLRMDRKNKYKKNKQKRNDRFHKAHNDLELLINTASNDLLSSNVQNAHGDVNNMKLTKTPKVPGTRNY